MKRLLCVVLSMAILIPGLNLEVISASAETATFRSYLEPIHHLKTPKILMIAHLTMRAMIMVSHGGFLGGLGGYLAVEAAVTQDLVITRGLVIVQEVTAVNHRLHIHKQETKLQLLLQH